MSDNNLQWIKVGQIDDLTEGRVKSVTARDHSICLSHFDGQWAAMDNKCPHQGGPLGEGSIERGTDGQCWIRCPWHGWDFDDHGLFVSICLLVARSLPRSWNNWLS